MRNFVLKKKMKREKGNKSLGIKGLSESWSIQVINANC